MATSMGSRGWPAFWNVLTQTSGRQEKDSAACFRQHWTGTRADAATQIDSLARWAFIESESLWLESADRQLVSDARGVAICACR